MPFKLRDPIRIATVGEISGSYCSITFDGIVYLKAIPIVGNPELLSPGAPARVQYIDNRPVVLAQGQSAGEGLSTSIVMGTTGSSGGDTPILNVLEGPGISVANDNVVGLGGDSILLYRGDSPVEEFEATDAGLTAALAAATASDDVVELPDLTISGGPWTVSAGILRGHSRFGSTLDGEVTVSTGCRLERLSVVISGDDAGALYCVELEEDARVEGCFISMTNATGDAYGVYAQHDGDCYANDNIVFATGGGDGYGYYADGAEMWVSGGYVEASTAPVGVA